MPTPHCTLVSVLPLPQQGHPLTDVLSWWLQDYEVVLMVGAGIGVTPFASVLGDLVNRLETKKCKLCNRVRATRLVLR